MTTASARKGRHLPRKRPSVLEVTLTCVIGIRHARIRAYCQILRGIHPAGYFYNVSFLLESRLALVLGYLGRDGVRMASGTLFTGAIPSTAESFTSSIIYVSSPGVREAVIDFPECATYCDQIWATWTVTSAGGIDKRGTGRINPKHALQCVPDHLRQSPT